MAKDPVDFDSLHEEFRPKVLRYLARLVGSSEAEDLSQEVFVKVSRALPGFKGESSLSTWIYRIATNTALDRLRSPGYKRESPAGGAVDIMQDSSGMKDDALPADLDIERKQMSECVRGVVDRLPPDYKTVIVLSELGELSNRQVAEVLEISLEAAKARLHRARTRLKAELQDACSFSRDERNEFVCEPKAAPIAFKKK